MLTHAKCLTENEKTNSKQRKNVDPIHSIIDCPHLVGYGWIANSYLSFLFIY